MNKLDQTYSRVAFLIAEAMVGCYETPEPKKPSIKSFNGDILGFQTAFFKWQKDAIQYQYKNETQFNLQMRDLLLAGFGERNIDIHPAESIRGKPECTPSANPKYDKPPPRSKLDDSIEHYIQINSASTNNFRLRHMLLTYCRQDFIQEYWNNGEYRNHSEFVSLESKQIKQIFAIASPHGQDRVRDLLAKGYFATGGGKSRRQTFVLSKAKNLFIEIAAGPQLNIVRFSVVEQNFDARVMRNNDDKIFNLGRI